MIHCILLLQCFANMAYSLIWMKQIPFKYKVYAINKSHLWHLGYFKKKVYISFTARCFQVLPATSLSTMILVETARPF